MARLLDIGLIYLFIICNICQCFNDSSLPVADTSVSVNETAKLLDVSGVAVAENPESLTNAGDLVNGSLLESSMFIVNMSDLPMTATSVNESVLPFEVTGVIEEPPKPLMNPGDGFKGPHQRLESTGFIVNMSDIPLLAKAIPVNSYNNGTNGTLITLSSSAVLTNNEVSVKEGHTQLISPLHVSATDSAPLTLSCDRCLPPLMTGADLFLGMAQWNSLVCGESVCDLKLQEMACQSGSCEDCHCDSECIHYGDCCPDVFQKRAPQTPAAKLSCFSQQFIKSKKIHSQSYKMVGVCREGSDTFVTTACLNPDSMLIEENRPVYSNLTQLHYRNSHCAQCNGIEDGVLWGTKPFCENYVDFSRVQSHDELLQKLSDEEACAVHYVPPLTSPLRECHIQGDIIRTCNVTGNWTADVFQSDIERACGLYSQLIKFNTINYNNIFCAYCNGEELWANQDCQYPITEPNVVPFSMLLDIRSAATEEGSPIDQVTCGAEQVYDTNIDSCRPFLCPRGKIPENHQCTSLFKSAKGLGYIANFILTPKGRDFVVVRSNYQLWWDIERFTREPLSILNPQFNIFNLNMTYISHNATGFAEVYSADVQVAFLVGTDVPIHGAERLMNAYFSRPFWWYESVSSEPVYFDLTWLPDISSDRLKYPAYDLSIIDSEPYEVMSWKTYHSLEHLNLVPAIFLKNASAYIQVSGLLMCKRIELNATEFFVKDSRTITVKYSGETLREGDFLWNGDNVQICTNFTGQTSANESSSRRPFDQTEVSLTLVCTSLSLCGLAITLTIYLILPSLRTLPARNNIFLFANLFFAQLLFLTGSAAKVSTPICRTLAIFIHYFWLSTFCWKVVCAFHMFRLFSNPLKALGYSRLLLKYIVFAQLTPCAIISVVVGVNVVVSGMERFGYAERPNLCFLSGTLDVALGFVTPVCLAVLINVMFFTRVVYVLRNRAKIQRHTSQSDVKESVLYFKMSLILGFTWVLGFLALIVDDIGLWYVFTVINASIGIFVFVGFGLKNVSLTSLLHGFGTKNNSSTNSSKTYETGDGTPKSNKNGRYSQEN